MDEVVKAKRKKVLKPAECKKHIQEKLAQNFEAIVDGFVEEAKKGSCPHVKLANELLDKAAPGKKGPAELMLEKWTRGGRPKVARVGLARGRDGRFVVKAGVVQTVEGGR
jgi:hypothetical protein